MRLGVKTILTVTVLLLVSVQIAVAIEDANNIKFPYIAEVTGANINIRSGAGTNFYRCGKISEPMRVVVVDNKYIWSKILPPQGSFSWVFKQYVKQDANDPRRGSITTNDVSVYAGGENLDPIRCETVQIKVSTGDVVQIVESPAGDYYKIIPPEGACLWTSSQYLKFVRDAAEMELKIPEIAPLKSKIAPIKSTTKTTIPTPMPQQIIPQNRVLENYYDLVRKFEDEKAKPLTQQDYSVVKAELNKMINDPNSGDAGSYSKYLLKQIARCELGQDSQKMLQKQQKNLEEVLGDIDKEWESRKANMTSLGKFAAFGTLKPSMVYQANVTTKRFLVVDESNNPICYAEPTGDAVTVDLKDFTEQVVGLTGEIKADSQSNLALVVFDKIEKLDSKK